MRRDAASSQRARWVPVVVIAVLAAATLGSIATTAQGAAGDVYNVAGALTAALLGLVASGASGQPAANVTYRINGVTPVGPDQHVMLSIANVSATTCSAKLSLVDQNGLTVAHASVSVPPGQGAAMIY